MRKKIPINYTDRDFNSIKQSLIDYAKRYYPNNFKDFNEASFGSMVIDTVAYVGDILSFYLDYQTNESFLDTAIEYNNLIKLGKQLGFKFRGNPSSTGIQTFYIIVPADVIGTKPDFNYFPKLLRGSSFGSSAGNQFILTENVDFSNSNNEIVVAEVDDTTGLPTSYAVKAQGKIISGEIVEEIIPIGSFQKFLKIQLGGENISEILSVTDAEGHDYYEVDYLSQNIIYKSIINRGSDGDAAPEILKPIIVPRRYVVEQDRNATFLQFGYGTEENITDNVVEDPSEVVLDVFGKDYITSDTFDPSKLLETDKFGVAPSNTTLSVVYRKNSTENVNSAANSITEVIQPIFDFENITQLDTTKTNNVVSSLETSNDETIIGDVSLPTSEELKIRIKDKYASQNRAVTREDYKTLVYNMPPRFGSIKRVNVVPDRDSFKRNLNMYVVSENQNGSLVQTSDTIKQNLKVWINQNKMINDTIDILDAVIVNIGINFEAIAVYEENKYVVLNNAVNKIIDRYQNLLDIGEPFSITDIYNTLKEVDGIADVTNVQIVTKTVTGYSDANFNVNEHITADGRLIMAEENTIFEIKFPKVDIVGSIL
jgi:hypothetical protein